MRMVSANHALTECSQTKTIIAQPVVMGCYSEYVCHRCEDNFELLNGQCVTEDICGEVSADHRLAVGRPIDASFNTNADKTTWSTIVGRIEYQHGN